MNTLPRRHEAAVVNIHTRQPMEVTTPPQRQNGRRLPWHKAPCRMHDPKFLALPPTAMAALRNLDELCANGPVVGKQGHVAIMVGVEPKHFHHAFPPLVEAGFITVEERNGVLTVDVIDPSNTPSTGAQQVSKGTSTGVQRCSNRNKQSANDAGFPPRSLIESEKEKEIEKENPPSTPPRKATKGSPEFEAFFRNYPNKGPKPEAWAQWQALNDGNGPTPEEVTAIMAGLERAKASETWARGFVVQACRFIRDYRWTDAWPAAVTDGDAAWEQQRKALAAEFRV